ncbi:GspH/FimT family pseudopilin [Inmirania thermothiophila]|uniref:Type II secretion system protein H n=1 Tax=Inmirania thermothiophila TaxID=1750597 RepID=A0A3N1Y845_9GAMM|nr:GspH/FimT family pseudopilin [Inmirania thermothiophila]ROR34989.1 type IV fimbrial biogenesis protein FimT [Inmirania thermothiophila]
MRGEGFTLIELLVTLAVAAVLLTVGVPSVVDWVRDGRMTSQVNELVAALHLARGEAVKRRTRVVVCASADGASCGGSGVGWEDGWIVFVDTNGDGAKDSGEALLGQAAALSGGNSVKAAIGSVSYRSDGTPAPLGAGTVNGVTFTFCDSRGAGDARAVVLRPTGAVSTGKRDADGNALSCT